MTQLNFIEGEIRNYQERIAHLRDVAAGLRRFPEEDPFEDGEVLSFQKTFIEGGRVYDYVILRCNNGLWYTSGPQRGATPRTWHEIVDFMATGVEGPIVRVKIWETAF